MTPAAKIPCVLYAAKSTEDTHGSIPTQLQDGRAMAEREGWAVVGEFQDEGFSAYSGNRGPGLKAARELAAEVKGVLVAQHSDRLARGAGDAPEAADHFVEVVIWANRHEVVIRTVQDDFFQDPRTNISQAANTGQRNTEDSRRKSEAVKSAKDRQMAAGTKLGGPPPEGLLLVVERDDQDRVRARRYERDPERAPIIERVFELSEEGHGDATIARTLNADGLRSKAGKAWTRRSVQDKLLNQHYAGRAVRKGRGSKQEYRLLEKPEVVQATNIEPLIDPDRYDRIIAMREGRDRVKARGKDGLRKGERGQKTERYALSRLAVCDRCGEPMYAQTSTYKRKTKGGTKARKYVCANYHNSTGVCDQPRLDAEKIDDAVIGYLDGLFLDYEAFVEELSSAADKQRTALDSAVGAALSEIDKADGRAGKIEADYIRRIEAGEDAAADVAARALDRVHLDRARAEQKVEACRQQLAALDDQPHNVALDTVNAVKKALSEEGGTRKLNERLRATFQEFRIDQIEDGTIGILPVLQPQVIDRSSFDAFAWLDAWEEAGEPDLTPEQEAEYHKQEAENRAMDRQEDLIRVPAKPLKVLTGEAPNQQVDSAAPPDRRMTLRLFVREVRGRGGAWSKPDRIVVGGLRRRPVKCVEIEVTVLGFLHEGVMRRFKRQLHLPQGFLTFISDLLLLGRQEVAFLQRPSDIEAAHQRRPLLRSDGDEKAVLRVDIAEFRGPLQQVLSRLLHRLRLKDVLNTVSLADQFADGVDQALRPSDREVVLGKLAHHWAREDLEDQVRSRLICLGRSVVRPEDVAHRANQQPHQKDQQRERVKPVAEVLGEEGKKDRHHAGRDAEHGADLPERHRRRAYLDPCTQIFKSMFPEKATDRRIQR